MPVCLLQKSILFQQADYCLSTQENGKENKNSSSKENYTCDQFDRYRKVTDLDSDKKKIAAEKENHKNSEGAPPFLEDTGQARCYLPGVSYGDEHEGGTGKNKKNGDEVLRGHRVAAAF